MGERDDDGEKFFADLRDWKVPEEEIARLKAEHRRDAGQNTIEVEPENAGTVRIFLRAVSQWRSQTVVAGNRILQVRTGLDYAVLPTIAGALGIALDAAVLDGVGVMEGIALEIYRRRQEEALRRR